MERKGWDYVTFNAHYLHRVDVPSTMKGFSGGGIWAVLLRLTPSGKIEIEDHCLVGSVFSNQLGAEMSERSPARFTRELG